MERTGWPYRSDLLDIFQLPDIEIPLDDSNSTIFKFVQCLVTQSTSCGKAERLKRIWEPTYTYVTFFAYLHCLYETLSLLESHRDTVLQYDSVASDIFIQGKPD